MTKTKAASALEETTKAAKRKRLNLDISMSSYEDLLRLTEETGKNMVEILRTGLTFCVIAHEARKKGQSLAIIQGDKIIKELLVVS